jgi:hypothetical protein
MPRRRSQVGTFGHHLQNFARSVDIVDNQTLNEARNLVYDYIQEELGGVYFELARSHLVDDSPGLRTLWSSAGKDFSFTIRTAEGRYSSQLAVCYNTGRPLWVVNPEQQPLRRTSNYVDMWSRIGELPSYKEPVDRDLLTSIILPIFRPNNRILGVMYLESEKHLDINGYDTRELELLADALGVLIDLRDLNEVQSQGTQDAVKNLRRIKESVVFPQIAKPQIFVAFSSRADQEVVGVIGDILNEYVDRLRPLQWNWIDDSGTISIQIAEAITRSRFGLCYLSERLGETSDYTDNPNVLVEAGMFHALTFQSMYEEVAWIPLREENSPPAPFDLVGERFELVPRTVGGRLNQELFRSRLRVRIGRLLSQ